MSEDADQYCRDLEAYLCRRNEGHLVRLVGPSFDMVQQWFRLGVPFAVACQGIDRKIARQASKPQTRRRPLRIEFCDADVLEAFDTWRRAVGISLAAAAPATGGAQDSAVSRPDAPDDDEAPAPRGRLPLASHLERTIARLTPLRCGTAAGAPLAGPVEEAERRLDALIAPARKARGAAREAVVAELARIDEAFLAAVRAAIPGDVCAAADTEAVQELRPFRARLSDDAYVRALERASARALRRRLDLPILTLD